MKNLNDTVVGVSRKWKERAKQDRSNRRNITKTQAFALALLDFMDSKNSQSRKN